MGRAYNDKGQYENAIRNRISGLKLARELILSEQKEPCEYCGPKTSKFEPIFISDTLEDCKWCGKEECDNYEDSCYGIGYSNVPLNHCPNCGRPLNQPIES